MTGTDCFGFVSFLWNNPRVSTRVFAQSTDYLTIGFSEIRPGDALVKSGSHIVLILEADTLTEVVISEASSTVRGCRERIVDLTDPQWVAYKTIRYPKLIQTLRNRKFYHKSKTGSQSAMHSREVILSGLRNALPEY